MGENETGMTNAQKILTFVPLGLLAVFAGLLASGKIPLQNRVVTEGIGQVLVYTSPSATSECSAFPPKDEAGEGEDLTFVSFDGDDSIKYVIVFDSVVGSPLVEPSPYTTGVEYHINKGTKGKSYPYSVQNGKGCKTIQNIGIIVTH